MSDYTPTTDEVRRGYAETIDALGGMHLGHLMFDRWLARHDAEIAADVLCVVADTWRTLKHDGHWNLPDIDDPETSYSPDRWLEVFADQIEREAGI